MSVKQTIGIMQPTYLPWLGYFEMISSSDVFVFLDDVQFQKKSWQQRNRIKGVSGPLMLTVPVLTKGKRFQHISGVCINNQENWSKKHLRSFEVAYAMSRYYKDIFPVLQEIYSNEWDSLVDLNVSLILSFMQILGITTPTILSSNLNIDATGNEKIVAICNYLHCDRLYDAAGAIEFIDANIMEHVGIEVIYQKYTHPIYNQINGDFVPYMSVIDILFNEGQASMDIILSGATPLPN
jgi:hypothetical protein